MSEPDPKRCTYHRPTGCAIGTKCKWQDKTHSTVCTLGGILKEDYLSTRPIRTYLIGNKRQGRQQ